jgi:Zn-dependent protease
MRGSIKIAVIAGIGIYLHWTFALLMVWLFMAGLIQGGTLAVTLLPLAFVLSLFACVLLHELGHALTAKRFGIKTRDITLLPIGGLARLERIPEKPMQEFLVAIAGPLVNLIIAAILFIVIAAQGGSPIPSQSQLSYREFLPRLLSVNLFLVAFNLLPAFPMDGGRILRALLAVRMGRRRATAIAAQVGQFMAVLFGIVGFLYSPLLIFIAIFVYIGAQAEAELVETTSLIEGLQVKDAMMTRFRTLTPQDTLQTAVSELLAGSQEDFPIVSNEEIKGVLRRQDLIQGLANGGREKAVADLASRDCPTVELTDSLERTVERMRRDGCKTLPVFDAGRIVGLLTLENIAELVMVRSALVGTGAGQRRMVLPS